MDKERTCNYKPKTGSKPDPANCPRKLSKEEIASIVNQLPQSTGLGLNAKNGSIFTNYADKQIRKFTALELSQIELDPTMIPELTKEIIFNKRRAQVQSGEPVGISMGEGFGSSVTQSTLNTFKVAGTAQVTQTTSGINAFRELAFVTQKRKEEKTHVYFKDRLMDSNDLLVKASEIIGVNLGKITNNSEVISQDDFEMEWWHELYIAFTGIRIPNYKSMLRLHLNVDSLYEYRISMKDIVTSLASEPQGVITVITSPLSIGIIDIFPDSVNIMTFCRKKLNNIDEGNAGLTYIYAFSSALDKRYLKGIDGIEYATVNKVPMLSVITKTEVLGDTKVKAYISKARMRTATIQESELKQLITSIGLEWKQVDKKHGFLTVEISGLPPKKSLSVFVEEKGKENDKISRMSNICNLVIYGTLALKEIIKRSDVIPEYCWSNSLQEMTQLLDVEAARIMFMLDVNQIIETSDAYVAPNLRSLMGDIIYARGVPTGLAFSGTSKGNNGPFSLASTERVTSVLTKAAVLGIGETTSSTSVAIATGQLVSSGTGGVTVRLDAEKQAQRLKHLKEAIERGEQVNPALLGNAVMNMNQTKEVKYLGDVSQVEYFGERSVKMSGPEVRREPPAPSANENHRKNSNITTVQSILEKIQIGRANIGKVTLPPPSLIKPEIKTDAVPLNLPPISTISGSAPILNAIQQLPQPEKIVVSGGVPPTASQLPIKPNIKIVKLPGPTQVPKLPSSISISSNLPTLPQTNIPTLPTTSNLPTSIPLQTNIPTLPTVSNISTLSQTNIPTLPTTSGLPTLPAPSTITQTRLPSVKIVRLPPPQVYTVPK